MGRRHHHVEHVNHEAWAIPYGDLVTLLLAFFVVMYAISSVNEGKYRVMADSMSQAFGGHSKPAPGGGKREAHTGAGVPIVSPGKVAAPILPRAGWHESTNAPPGHAPGSAQLDALGQRVEGALAQLMRAGVVTIRRGPDFLEIRIQSDLLFASGAAVPSATARATVETLGDLLRGEPNGVRVEGYTDNRPIHTNVFVSNWELSAARAASIVHLLVGRGVAPARLAVVGYGEHHPIADNTTLTGRNANRRVQLVIAAPPAPIPAEPAPSVPAASDETRVADAASNPASPAPAAMQDAPGVSASVTRAAAGAP